MFDFFDDSCGCRGVDLGNKAAKGQDYSETQRYEAALDGPASSTCRSMAQPGRF